MKIIIAPDSFRGSLTAREASSAMELGVHAAMPDAEIEIIPMADGGEGTLEALVSSTRGKYVEADTIDPLGRKINAKYGILGNCKTAVIELAVASGILLLKKEEQNPLYTTTYGTGQLIRHALESGIREFIICIGGSSTNDCGTGIVQALGVRFFRKDGSEITENICGGILGDVSSVDMSGLHPAIRESLIIVACDVKNTLLGEKGCSLMYSPQKGATPQNAEKLEKYMRSFIGIAEKTIGIQVREVPGAGAAGGAGAGLMLFLNAELQPGISIVMEACNFPERILDADLILTGEGKIDDQTAYGKTIAGIALMARTAKVPVLAFGGIVEGADNLYELGITNIYPIRDKSISIEESMAQASAILQSTVTRILQNYRRSLEL